ncbi:Uncharacterised protein [Mycobacteroides abscessus subsp. abscessus]|nr:Uncharacterised protein [Mycobacteroides abscessus subsp. abscessus]
MAELTPERIREAADVADEVLGPYALRSPADVTIADLRRSADALERKQAAAAKRERGVAELANWIEKKFYSHNIGHTRWQALAGDLIDRYPTHARCVDRTI